MAYYHLSNVKIIMADGCMIQSHGGNIQYLVETYNMDSCKRNMTISSI
ncbi:BnaA09g10120D [Brassica napus]|uniref:(rape) hypothetical protein n=1 Tax=Brassica napus TaxID=3708 RepID=A0A078HMK3_BRANA|nr:unnamed protein product [Brassica napus]CAF2229836.1 unnamed protein product [Brassica napus]CDY39760.1 BnaA09g10120D [Brassica napus]